MIIVVVGNGWQRSGRFAVMMMLLLNAGVV